MYLFKLQVIDISCENIASQKRKMLLVELGKTLFGIQFHIYANKVLKYLNIFHIIFYKKCISFKEIS